MACKGVEYREGPQGFGDAFEDAPGPGDPKRRRRGGPWSLISEDMDGEPRWVRPEVTSTRVAHVRDQWRACAARSTRRAQHVRGRRAVPGRPQRLLPLRLLGRSPRPEQAPAHRLPRCVRQESGRDLPDRHRGMGLPEHAAPAGTPHRPARRRRPGADNQSVPCPHPRPLRARTVVVRPV